MSIRPPIVQRKYRIGDRQILDRQGRAICRILYAQGKSTFDIASIIQASRTTVKKAIKNGYAVKDIVEDDYKYVRGILDGHIATRPTTWRDSEEGMTIDNSTVPVSDSGATIANLGGIPPNIEECEINIDTLDMHPEMAEYSQVQQLGAPNIGYGLPYYAYQDSPVQDQYQDNTHIKNYVACDPMRVFLSQLKFDLSAWYLELRARGLGTYEEILAISDWEEHRLDRIFAEILPTMPEMYRFALTEGITGMGKHKL